MQCDCYYWKIVFLVYMYYTHPSYRTSIVGKICAYYIRIFTVYIYVEISHVMVNVFQIALSFTKIFLWLLQVIAESFEVLEKPM